MPGQELGGKQALLNASMYVGTGSAVGSSMSKDTFDEFGRKYHDEMRAAVMGIKKKIREECEMAAEAKFQKLKKNWDGGDYKGFLGNWIET